MSDSKISALLALSLIASPMALPASAPAYDTTASSETTSYRTAARRMRHQLGGDYIRPAEANHIDAPLPLSTASDEIVGIYGNILYPLRRVRRGSPAAPFWPYPENGNTPFCLSCL